MMMEPLIEESKVVHKAAKKRFLCSIYYLYALAKNFNRNIRKLLWPIYANKEITKKINQELRNQYENVLAKRALKTNHINELSTLKDHYTTIITKWRRVGLSIIILCLAIFLTMRVPTTIIRADLTLSAISLRTHKPFTLDQFGGNFTHKTAGPISITTSEFNHSGKNKFLFSEKPSELRIKPDSLDPLISINRLTIPGNSIIDLNIFNANNINLDVSAFSDDVSVAGQLAYGSGKFINISENSNTTFPPFTFDGSADRYLLDFSKKFKDKQPFRMSLENTSEFMLPSLMVSNMNFTEKSTYGEQLQSSILYGSIRLLDTNNDSVRLNLNDTAVFSFNDTPFQVQIQKNSEGIRVRFEAEVERCYVGPMVKHLKNNNKMPIRLKTISDQQIALLSLLIPVILILFLREKKAL